MARNRQNRQPRPSSKPAQSQGNGSQPQPFSGVAVINGQNPAEQIHLRDEQIRKLLEEIGPYKADIAAARETARIEALAQQEAANQELRQAAEEQAREIRLQAGADADGLREEVLKREAAVAEAERAFKARMHAKGKSILAEAKAHADEIVAEARGSAQKELANRISALEARETAIKEIETALGRREVEIKAREAENEEDRHFLGLRKTKINERWALCSPDRVAELELDLTAEQKVSQVHQKRAASLEVECQRLRDTLAQSGGQSLEALSAELRMFQDRCRELEDRRASTPSDEEIALLRRSAAEADRTRTQLHDLRCNLAETEERASRNELQARETEQARAQYRALCILNEQLRRELDRNAEHLQGKHDQRFKGLMDLDGAPARPQPAKAVNSPIKLSSLASFVRQYAANPPTDTEGGRTPLYYSETVIRAFIAGLATSHLSILQGLSGTGKTSLPKIFAEATGGICERIPVQSNWRDRHELVGYNNDFTRQFTETDFTKAVYESGLPRERDRIWFIVLDEMNLARVEYYFADFLSALEERSRDEQVVTLLSFDPATQGEPTPQNLAGGALRIPANVWFIGTANEDQSTFEITDKVYDRAQVIEFKEPDEEYSAKSPDSPRYLRWSILREAFAAAKSDASGQITQQDLAFVDVVDQTLRQTLDLTFGHRIRSQMRDYVPVYVACGGTKSEAVDYFLAHKVLRKINNRHDANLQTALDELAEALELKLPPGYQKMDHSLRVVESLRRKLLGRT